MQADNKLYINQDVNTRCVYVMLEMVFYYQEKEGSGQPTHSFSSWLIKTFCSPNQNNFLKGCYKLPT